jgi:hypothetical protein
MIPVPKQLPLPLPGFNQRWRSHKVRYRPAGEVIDTRLYEVEPIDKDSGPRAFVRQHHYTASYPAARRRFGIFQSGECVGVAVFSNPCSDLVLLNAFPGLTSASCALELGRFVLLDTVPGNGETYMLARCFELLRKEGFAGVVAFSDPVPRTTARGDSIFVGHWGSIYAAHNATYLGRATPRTLRLLPDGRVLSDRTIQKIRAGHRGWRGGAAILQSYGAGPAPEDPHARSAWLAGALATLTRPLRHTGNYKYCWALDPALSRSMPASLPWPVTPVQLAAIRIRLASQGLSPDMECRRLMGCRLEGLSKGGADYLLKGLGAPATASQLAVIRSAAASACVDSVIECERSMGCALADLTMAAADAFIDHLQEVSGPA